MKKINWKNDKARTRKSTKTKVENLLIVHPERSVMKAGKMLN